MYTKEDLRKALEISGVSQTKPVLVHTSLKAVGQVAGGAETVLSALREYVTSRGGILMIPTHTWDNYIEGREYSLDLMNLVPCIGTLPKVAALSPDAIISENPTHSIAFFGDRERVEAYIASEADINTPASPEGCYAKLVQERGEVLLLGVDQTKNTFLHAMEEKLLGNVRYGREPVSLKIRRADGSVIHRLFYVFDESEIGDVSERFHKFEKPFRKYGAIRDGVFGSAKIQLCRADVMAQVMKIIYENAAGKELLASHEPIPEDWY